MQKLFLTSMAVVVVLATGFCVIVISSIIPYFPIIGKMAVVVVGVLLFCIAVLLLFFTWSRIGVWGNRRRMLISGDVVVYLRSNGEVVHLSAEHERAKVQLPNVTVKEIAAPKEQKEQKGQQASDDDTVLELYDIGNSQRDIAEKTNLTRYRVSEIIKKNRG